MRLHLRQSPELADQLRSLWARLLRAHKRHRHVHGRDLRFYVHEPVHRLQRHLRQPDNGFEQLRIVRKRVRIELVLQWHLHLAPAC
jgi:hypothetical protein